MILLRFLALLLIGQLLIAAPTAARAGEAASLEHKIKAAYLYNFSRFVTWPAERTNSGSVKLTVCTFGEDRFGNALDALAGKIIRGRELDVARQVTFDDIANCALLFFEDGSSPATELLTACQERNILTVGNGEEFTKLGGVIRFKLREKSERFQESVNVSFEINKDAADRSDLKISSRLLQLASAANRT